VVHRVHAPQQLEPVAAAVDPVGAEVPDDQRERELQQHRPLLGPQGAADGLLHPHRPRGEQAEGERPPALGGHASAQHVQQVDAEVLRAPAPVDLGRHELLGQQDGERRREDDRHDNGGGGEAHPDRGQRGEAARRQQQGEERPAQDTSGHLSLASVRTRTSPGSKR
jgi:hypothetical protein